MNICIYTCICIYIYIHTYIQRNLYIYTYKCFHSDLCLRRNAQGVCTHGAPPGDAGVTVSSPSRSGLCEPAAPVCGETRTSSKIFTYIKI